MDSRDLTVSVEIDCIAAALELLAEREHAASRFGMATLLEVLAEKAHALAMELDEGGWIKPEQAHGLKVDGELSKPAAGQ